MAKVKTQTRSAREIKGVEEGRLLQLPQDSLNRLGDDFLMPQGVFGLHVGSSKIPEESQLGALSAATSSDGMRYTSAQKFADLRESLRSRRMTCLISSSENISFSQATALSSPYSKMRAMVYAGWEIGSNLSRSASQKKGRRRCGIMHL